MDLSAQWSIIAEVALAMVLGGLIGLEREFAGKPAGFRTHMLVAGAAALLVALGGPLLGAYRSDAAGTAIRSDPIRIVQAAITGIAFLGAGTIIRGRDVKMIEGLTTASSLLFTGAIGISVALRQFLVAAAITVLGLAVLSGAAFVERWIARRLDKS